MGYSMTHYMELMANNQPWNLLFFMAIPLICAETLAITELIVLYKRNMNSKARRVSRTVGIFSGIYFLGIFLYLLISIVIPLTVSGEWRGIIDILAISFYMLGVVPFLCMAFYEFGFIGKTLDDQERIKFHAQLVGFFLISSHIAIIFGLMNPHIFLTFMQ